MADASAVAAVREGRSGIARWREEHPGQRLDLSGADFHRWILSGLDLVGANLSRTMLNGARLRHTRFDSAILQGAQMIGCYLERTVFDDADLSDAILGEAWGYWASLRRATARGTSFSHSLLIECDFWDTDLFKASFDYATLVGVDLGTCRGISTVVSGPEGTHVTVSTLTQTLRSEGGNFLPETRGFFERSGVPAALLDYLPGVLATSPIQLYTCVISYTPADDAIAQQLYADLVERGIRCWKYDESAVAGRGVWANIDRAIRHHDKVVVLCSETSLNKPGVLREIERALQKEDDLVRMRQSRPNIDADVLLALRLDDYMLTRWDHPRAADVRAKHALDFSRWMEESHYRRQFARLLTALSPRTWP